MPVRVGINGFGRIGRTFLRNVLDQDLKNVEVVCINDAYMDPKFMGYIFEYDSIFGKYKGKVEFRDNKLYVDGKAIQIQRENEPSRIKWKDAGVDIVIESTGFFTTMEKAEGHLKAGAKRVILTSPSQDVPMYVRGVNLDKYRPDQKIISSASETTYCTALLCKLLQEHFKINVVTIDVVHAATSQQRTVDGPPLHREWRTGRSVHNNIIPTETAATYALGKIIPELDGRVIGHGTRVPHNNVSYVVLNLVLDQAVPRKDLIKLIQEMSEKPEYKDLLAWNEHPLVSGDFCGRKESAIVDFNQLNTCREMVQLPAWFDNEWGYSRRLCDLLCHVAKQDERKGGMLF